jgi:hypothetical protein
MTANVLKFPVAGKSIDEAMSWLAELHAKGDIVEIVAVAADKDGHYVFAQSEMSAKDLLFMTTYMQERVRKCLQQHGLMPTAAGD